MTQAQQQRKIFWLESGRVLEAIAMGLDLPIGARVSVEARLGDEGLDSWTRWEFEVSPAHILLAERRLADIKAQ